MNTSSAPIMNQRKHPIALAATCAAALLLVACGARPPHAALEQARQAVNQAAATPAVAESAALDLKAASDTLARADRVWAQDGDSAETAHLAYLASQRAAIAQTKAQGRAYDEQLRNARAEASQMRLQARTREAEAARAEAQRARQSAEAARAEAQRAQQSAEAARAEAARQQNAASAAQARVADLEAKLREIEAQQTERGLLVTLGDVLFEFGKADLLSAASPRLDKLATFLKQFPERRLLVEGYTDSIGSASYNLELSRRRAIAVQAALVQRGIAPDRILTQGYGKEYPVANNATAEGRAMNRRVEVIITDDQGVLRGRGQ